MVCSARSEVESLAEILRNPKPEWWLEHAKRISAACEGGSLNIIRDGDRVTIESAAGTIAEINGTAPRVLVCGGREYTNAALLAQTLEASRRDRGIAVLIAGGAPGADSLAADWAVAQGIPCDVYMADWEGLGRKAGPIRNQRMLDEGKPDLVVAFPGGRGTADMVRPAKAIGLELLAIAE